MSEINHFKVFILCKIMWHNAPVICQLLCDVLIHDQTHGSNNSCSIVNIKQIKLIYKFLKTYENDI
jgi:hypothetical protein